MTDEELFDEVARRVENDSGLRYDLAYALRTAGLTVNDLEPDEPRRVWLLRRGEWLSPRCETDPYRPLPAPLVFLGSDEFGHHPICVRLPGHRLLCLNWRIPLKRELYEPEVSTP